jgi:hypothetical protein
MGAKAAHFLPPQRPRKENEMKTFACFKTTWILIAAVLTALIPLTSCFQPLGIAGGAGTVPENTRSGGTVKGGISWEGIFQDLLTGAAASRSGAPSRAVEGPDWGMPEEDETAYRDVRYTYYLTQYGIITTDMKKLFAATSPNSRILPRMIGISDNLLKNAYLDSSNVLTADQRQSLAGTPYAACGAYAQYADAWRKDRYLAAVDSVTAYLDQWIDVYQRDHSLFTGREQTVDLNHDFGADLADPADDTDTGYYGAADRFFSGALSNAAFKTTLFGAFGRSGAESGKIALTLAGDTTGVRYYPHATPATIAAVYGDETIAIPSIANRVATYYDGLAAVWLKPISLETWIEIAPLDPNGGGTAP